MEYSDSSTQAEQLKTIGSKLSHEREARSVSLAAVATKTYIPLRLLTAIEDGRLDLLPEPVFIQGFIRRYADTLGLDGTALSKEFAIESPVLNYETEPLPIEPVEVQAKPSERPLWLYVLGGAIGLGAVALIIANLVNHPQKAEPPTSKPLTTNSITSQPAKPQTTARSSNSVQSTTPLPSALPSSSASAKPVTVSLNASDESWVQVIVDGKVAFEGTLQKGTQKSWGGQKQIIISAGNAGGVSVSYNNGAAKPLGAAGDVVQDLKFPPTP